jgi:DNA polymerase I-like protein with 3'-5' exonuclease and polymerase domains
MKSGADMHVETARYLFDKETVSDNERAIAKVCNYGLIFGVGVPVFRQTLRSWANIILNFNEVKALMRKWFDKFEYFREWHNIHKHQIQVYGYVDIQSCSWQKGKNLPTSRFIEHSPSRDSS